MYFTREPLIETIISPREGYKLVLRSSKLERQEEYSVDSVEVISFGNHCFYRSLDRSETFLLPVFDYEVIETKSTRLALKTMGTQEKEIKIGKPREVKPPQEERKRDNKRGGRKNKERGKTEVVAEEAAPMVDEPEKVVKPERESLARILIPPPSSLISDTLSRYQMPSVEKGVEPEKPVVSFSEEGEAASDLTE